MKLAYSTLACPNWSLAQVITTAQHNGYEGLEMRLLNGEILSPSLDKTAREQVRSQCRAANLPIICVDTSLHIATPDAEGQALQRREGLAFLELAAEWEAPFIRVFGGPPAGTPNAEALKASAECLTTLGQRGQALGVTVLLETHDAFSSSTLVMEVLNLVPTAGALWDTLHPFRVGEQPAETAARLGERCQHVHIKDGRRGVGGEWELKLLGAGEVPIPAILATLQSQHYGGWLSVEWEKKWHPEIEEPEIAIPQHAELLRKYLATIG